MSGNSPLSYMTGAASRSAAELEKLAWGFSGISIAVVLIIALLIALAIRRSRVAASDDPLADVGRHGNGLALIWWGLGISLPILVLMAIWNFLTTRSLASVPDQMGPTVEVTGHRWWWEVRYDDPSGHTFSDANEVVIPVGVPVRLQLKSGDVIHDFWVPKLGPKMDMIPGRTNQTWLEADRPGIYRGQCAEFCGLEHAHMAFVVRALPHTEYAAWIKHQRKPSAGTSTGSNNQALSAQSDHSSSENMFVQHCGACHTVRGTAAGGILGPDLTHFAGRQTIAAGMMANTPQNLDRWLAAPQKIKPGSLMPQVQLTPAERAQMVRYLESLS